MNRVSPEGLTITAGLNSLSAPLSTVPLPIPVPAPEPPCRIYPDFLEKAAKKLGMPTGLLEIRMNDDPSFLERRLIDIELAELQAEQEREAAMDLEDPPPPPPPMGPCRGRGRGRGGGRKVTFIAEEDCPKKCAQENCCSYDPRGHNCKDFQGHSSSR